MHAWRLVYWLITGALLGLGLAQWLGVSLGVILLPIGLVLLIIGLFALRGRELVAGSWASGPYRHCSSCM